MEAKRLSEEVIKRLWGTHRGRGLIPSEIDSLFAHIAALEKEIKGLRDYYRWRDPSVELPKTNESVIVEYILREIDKRQSEAFINDTGEWMAYVGSGLIIVKNPLRWFPFPKPDEVTR